MDLKKVIEEIRNRRISDSDDALQAIAESERYFQQAYDGRYLFELIQNVRDANKEAGMVGSAIIELKEDRLIVSNTGAPFSREGVESITTIGKSPKISQEFIGFKGIGFKSVQEITGTPYIVTGMGSIVFNRDKTIPFLNERSFEKNQIPLFFIPHFRNEKLTKIEKVNGIVTQVVLPLKDGVELSSIIEEFKKIGTHQILLLGSLKSIQFISKKNTFHFDINENKKTGKVTITRDGEVEEFKRFTPSEKISIPKGIIDSLEDKEKKIYKKEPFVDISLVFDFENGRLKKNEDSKLFLFYPLKISSGFPFIIHSYFLVNPERTNLRNSKLNKFILEQVGEYLAGEWLNIAKRYHKSSFLSFLAFERNKDLPILNNLYDQLINSLKTKKILYDSESNRFYSISDVIIADGFDKGLFPDSKIEGKRLVYVNDEDTVRWLRAEFDVEYLNYEKIREYIEQECVKQKKEKNLSYFENLYKYVVEHDKLDLKGKKVLLTSHWLLKSSEDDVFYGMTEQNKVEFPKSIQKRIHFIHPDITISDQREGSSQTGYKEYKTEELVRRLLKLYEDKNVPKLDILHSLLQLEIGEKPLDDIRQAVWLPISGTNRWKQPFRIPIYIHSKKIEECYPHAQFLDLTKFEKFDFDEADLLKKLQDFGAWTIPAITFSSAKATIRNNEHRFKELSHLSEYNTNYFEITGDWILDVPDTITQWYTDKLIASWENYKKLMRSKNFPIIHYKSQRSDRQKLPENSIFKISSFLETIRTIKWIRIENASTPLGVEEVVGIDTREANWPSNNVIKRYINVLSITYQITKNFIRDSGLLHFDSDRFEDLVSILKIVFYRYKDLESVDKSFVDFYNRILGKLYEYHSSHDKLNDGEIEKLKETHLLAVNELNDSLEWKPGSEIYCVNDKHGYQLLPEDVKRKIQPQFTNRDRNRFGQIANAVGINYQNTINQTLGKIKVVNDTDALNFFPNLPECLVFIEGILDRDLDGVLPDFAKLSIHKCEKVNTDLFINDEFQSTLRVNFFLQKEDAYELYIEKLPLTGAKEYYALPIIYLLTELLERDVQQIKMPLIGFFVYDDNQHEKIYDLSIDRIAEVRDKIKDSPLSKNQEFWFRLLHSQDIDISADSVFSNKIDFNLLQAYLEIDKKTLMEIHHGLDYKNLNSTNNIQSIRQLLKSLGISLENFNSSTGYKIDFKDHFIRKFESVKERYKESFEAQLYAYLKDLGLESQQQFQNKMDKYITNVNLRLASPILWIDINDKYLQTVQDFFPEIGFQLEGCKSRIENLKQQYSSNFKKFESAIKKEKLSSESLEDFLDRNKHRSLLYFEDRLDDLLKIYREWSSASDTAEGKSDGLAEKLSMYKNSDSLTIEDVETTKVESTESSTTSNGTRGKRVDASKQNSNDVALVAEKMVFDKLNELHNHVKWVSTYAARVGVNPQGGDNHHCDIKFFDENNDLHFVEVKGKIDDTKEFIITFDEVKKALKEKDYYHIYFVPFALDNKKRRIQDLGNVFQLDKGDYLFSNKKFSATFKNLNIKFK